MQYKKIDKLSPDGVPEGLNFFSTPFTQVAIEKTYEREFQTLNAVKNPPWNFKILTGHAFLDGPKTKIVTALRLEKRDTIGEGNWVPTEEKDNIGVINGVGAYLFESMRLSVSGQQQQYISKLYPYHACIENELNFGRDAKESSMNAFGYTYDNNPRGNNITDSTKKTAAVKKYIASDSFQDRSVPYTNGQWVYHEAPLYLDMFQQPLYLLSNLNIELEITPHLSKFYVVAPEYEGEVRGIVEFCRVYCTFVELHPGVVMDIEKKLEQEPARYPMRRTGITNIHHEADRHDDRNVLFHDYIPRQLNAVFVEEKAFFGDQKLDPFNFHHFHLRDLTLRAGNMVVPNVPFDCDWETGKYIRAFNNLHTVVGLNSDSGDCGITRKMYLDGYNIWPFDLSTSQNDHDGFDFVRDGATVGDHLWNKKIPAGGIQGIYTGYWDQIMYIERTRSIRTDLTI